MRVPRRLRKKTTSRAGKDCVVIFTAATIMEKATDAWHIRRMPERRELRDKDDFSEILALKHPRLGFAGLVKRKNFVDDRAEFSFFDKADHFF